MADKEDKGPEEEGKGSKEAVASKYLTGAVRLVHGTLGPAATKQARAGFNSFRIGADTVETRVRKAIIPAAGSPDPLPMPCALPAGSRFLKRGSTSGEFPDRR